MVQAPSFTTDATARTLREASGSSSSSATSRSRPRDGSGTWHLFVSVQWVVTGGEGTTLNSATSRAVTLIDMTGRLGWATPGVPRAQRQAVGVTKSAARQRAAVGLADVYSVMRTEPNGVVEGYGGTAVGDFSIAVPPASPSSTGVEAAALPRRRSRASPAPSPASTSRSAPPTRRRPARSRASPPAVSPQSRT